jgi:hypothetical protein
MTIFSDLSKKTDLAHTIYLLATELSNREVLKNLADIYELQGET